MAPKKRLAGQQTGPQVPPPAVKPAEPEILEEAVIAYLNKQCNKLVEEIAEAEEQFKQVELQMLTNFNRSLGQLEGRKKQLETQLKALQAQLAPPTATPPTTTPPAALEALTGDENLPIM